MTVGELISIGDVTGHVGEADPRRFIRFSTFRSTLRHAPRSSSPAAERRRCPGLAPSPPNDDRSESHGSDVRSMATADGRGSAKGGGGNGASRQPRSVAVAVAVSVDELLPINDASMALSQLTVDLRLPSRVQSVRQATPRRTLWSPVDGGD